MKRALSIFAVATATLAVLFLTAVPHHHHGNRICFAIEHCESDEAAAPCADNDNHNHDHDETTCVLSHGTFIIEAENAGIRINAAESHLAQPLFVLAVECCSLPLAVFEPFQNDYGEEIVAGYFADCPSQCGLRAPPVC